MLHSPDFIIFITALGIAAATSGPGSQLLSQQLSKVAAPEHSIFVLAWSLVILSGYLYHSMDWR